MKVKASIVLLIKVCIFSPMILRADENILFESVVKEANFRASLILPSGAAFAQLSEGFT